MLDARLVSFPKGELWRKDVINTETQGRVARDILAAKYVASDDAGGEGRSFTPKRMPSPLTVLGNVSKMHTPKTVLLHGVLLISRNLERVFYNNGINNNSSNPYLSM